MRKKPKPMKPVIQGKDQESLPELKTYLNAGLKPRWANQLCELSSIEQCNAIAGLPAELDRRKREERMRDFKPDTEDQRKFWAALGDKNINLIIVSGGNQSGKTECTTEAAAMLLCNTGPLAKRFTNRPIYVRQCSPDFDQGVKKTLIPKWKEVIPRHKLRGGSWLNAYMAGDHQLFMDDNNSFVEWLTYRQDVELHQAAQRHLILLDEWPTEQIFKETEMRLLRYSGLMIIAATPTAGTAEAWQMQLLDDIKAGRIPNAAAFHFVSLHNRFIDQDLLAQKRAQMTPDEELMRVYGQFIPLGGRVLPELEPRIHFIDGFTPPRNAPTNVALDVHSNKANYGNFAALLDYKTANNPQNWPNGEILWRIEDPQETQLHIWEEFICGDTIEKTCEYLGMASGGRKVDSFQIERSVKQYDHNTGRAEFKEFRKHYPFKKWSGDAIGGRAILRRLCRVDEITQKTKFFVHKSCEVTREQLQYWSYKDPTIKGEQKPEEVRKVNDDMCDCCRAHGQWFEGHSESVQGQHFVPRMQLVLRRDPVTNAPMGYDRVPAQVGVY